MSKNLLRCFNHLQLVASVKNPERRKALLEDCSDNDCIYKAIREICINTINKKVPLTKSQKDKLKYKDKIITQFAKKHKKKTNRKKLVVQSGGFLPILIPTVAAVLTQLIRNGILKQSGGYAN